MSYTRILVPTDFSKEAETALQTAVLLAKKIGGHLQILHVLEVGQRNSINVSGGPSNERTMTESVLVHEGLKGAQESLERSVKLHDLVTQGVDYDLSIRLGNPFRKILECIDNKDIDLVVMGSKGAWGYSEVLVGSNTEKVVRNAPCPVLTVKSVTPESAFSSIVLPTEGKTHDKKILPAVKELQSLFDSKLHLVYVNTRRNFKPDTVIKPQLRAFAEENGLTNFSIHVYSDFSAEDGIRFFAEEIDAGMIAAGTHAHFGFARLIQGSVSEGLVNHAQRPVLTVAKEK